MDHTAEHTLKMVKAYLEGSLNHQPVDPEELYFIGYIAAVKNIKRFIEGIEARHFAEETSNA